MVTFAAIDATPGAHASEGWDAWAEDYARLPEENPVYALGKALLHRRVERLVASLDAPRPLRVLDFHCGAGNDLAELLARGHIVTGCDGSRGMLDVAARRHAGALADRRLTLLCGRAEDLDQRSLGDRRFDLVFSTTGGFAYVDDAELVRLHRVLAGYLRPGGRLCLAHLTPFCLAESVYHLTHGRPRRAAQRSHTVTVAIRGEPMRMHLRSARRLRRLLAGVVSIEALEPLLVCTPPFNSGYAPGPRRLRWHERGERVLARLAFARAVADQVLCVSRSAPA